jgi:hypothetical protein
MQIAGLSRLSPELGAERLELLKEALPGALPSSDCVESGRPGRRARASVPNIDYAMLIEMYEGDRGKDGTAEPRYSPAVCTGSREQTITAALDSLTRLAGPS